MRFSLTFLLVSACWIGAATCAAEDRLVVGDPVVLKHPPINKSIGNPVHCLVFLQDDARLATGATSGVHVWDAKSGELLQTLETDERSTDALAQDALGKHLISGGASGVIKIWDARTLKPVATLGQTPGAVRSLAISPNAKLLASASPNPPPSSAEQFFGIQLWDLTTNQLSRQIELPQAAFGSTVVVFLNDQQVLAAQDRSFRLIDVQQGKVIKTIERPELPRTIGCLAVDRDGQLATGVFEPKLRLWNTRDWKQTLAWEAHDKQQPPRSGVSAASFSPDGKYLLSGGLDGQVCVWDPATGRRLLELDARGGSTSGWVTGVAMSRNNRLLAATHFGGTATMWRLE
jgi:WD40 repeat protein